MKKILLFVSVLLICGNAVEAKDKKKKKNTETLELSGDTKLPVTNGSTTGAPATTLKAEDMEFTEMTHDFGTVQEGPDAVCKFTFVNKGKEPISIQKAQASCGCTVPTYSKDAIAPGATGSIDVAFHTAGKPAGGFTKTITVTSNAGMKILTIKGSVEKAPATSVPENNSMLKTN